MTIEKPKSGPRGYLPATDDPDAHGKTKDDEPESDEEKIKREQATNPALMPIGDPAGAA